MPCSTGIVGCRCMFQPLRITAVGVLRCSVHMIWSIQSAQEVALRDVLDVVGSQRFQCCALVSCLQLEAAGVCSTCAFLSCKHIGGQSNLTMVNQLACDMLVNKEFFSKAHARR
jgi:hypothetical protein